MKVLVAGASGATGRHVVGQLLERQHQVVAVVRSADRLPEDLKARENLEIITAPILEIPADALRQHVEDCDAIVSCLGHNMTMKGMFGKPRKLVTDAVKCLCNAVIANAPSQPVKLILMNTSGNRNPDAGEKTAPAERIVTGLIRVLVPPHSDNEQAAEYLRTSIGQDNPAIEWVAVRPDNLIDEDRVTDYEVFHSPVRSPIFNAGKTSRINVAHFMAQLATDDATWEKWKGQMPVIYNLE